MPQRNRFTRIQRNPAVLSGAPNIRGHRISVLNVVMGVQQDGLEDYLGDFPDISKEDVLEALEYCSSRSCDATSDDEHRYCGGCVLRRMQDSQTFAEFLAESGVQTTDQEKVYLEPGDKVFLGSLGELKLSWEGRKVWILAHNTLEVVRKSG